MGRSRFCVNAAQVDAGTGWDGDLREVDGEKVVVELGWKGAVELGVRRELRCVEMVSSRVERERRRKVGRASGWKQNVGVRRGGGGGWVMVRECGAYGVGGASRERRWREGRGGGGGDEGGGLEDAQNNDASVMSCDFYLDIFVGRVV